MLGDQVHLGPARGEREARQGEQVDAFVLEALPEVGADPGPIVGDGDVVLDAKHLVLHGRPPPAQGAECVARLARGEYAPGA